MSSLNNISFTTFVNYCKYLCSFFQTQTEALVATVKNLMLRVVAHGRVFWDSRNDYKGEWCSGNYSLQTLAFY